MAGAMLGCQAWNTLVETIAASESTNRFSTVYGESAMHGKVQRLSDARATDVPRMPTDIVQLTMLEILRKFIIYNR
jgi:predicted ATP-dependent serine protease